MKRKVIVAIGFTLTPIGVAVYSYYQDSDSFNLISLGMAAFWIAIAVGILVRLIRAKRGSKIRDAFGPVAAGVDAYQAILLSQPTIDQSTDGGAKNIPTDRSCTGP